MTNLWTLFKALRKDERGSFIFEALIVIPVIVSAMLLTVVAYNYWSDESRDIKAGLAIADAISRETVNITPAYLDTMYELQKFLTNHEEGIAFRIAAVRWDSRKSEYSLRWEQRRNSNDISIPDLDQERLKKVIPRLVAGENVVMVETFLLHHPAFKGPGLPSVLFNNIAVSRPRNGPQVCWAADGNPNSIYNTC